MFDNQERPTLVIISFILMTCTFDLKVILYGEIRSQTLERVMGENPLVTVEVYHGLILGSLLST